MSGLYIMAAVMAALLVGLCLGVKLEESAWRRTGKRQEKEKGKRFSASHLIAICVLLVDGSATYIVLYLCWLSIKLQFSGSLPYLTTLIGALQVATGYILGHYFKKATVENSKGGITYDAALGVSAAEQWNGTAAGTAGDAVSDSDTDL